MAELVRTSERSSFLTCRQRWHWGYVDGLKPIVETPALRFGDLIHQALAAYYKKGRKRGPHPAKTFERLYHESVAEQEAAGFKISSDDNWVDAADLGVRMLNGYVDLYHERDLQYEVIASEQTFRFPIREPGQRKPLAIYVGTFDGVWRDRAARERPLFFAEHKTASAVSLDGLPLDEQAGAYWTYGPAWLHRQGILPEDEEISHILYNYLRKSAPNPDNKFDPMGRKLNKDGSVSKQQPAPYFVRQPIYRDRADRENVHRRVIAEIKDMQEARANPEKVYKWPGPLHMPNCRGCGFRDMCELHETGNDWEAVRVATMTTWDPYADHELVERA